MPSKELHHLRRTVEAAKKLVKKPVYTFAEAEQEQARTAQPQPQTNATREA